MSFLLVSRLPVIQLLAPKPVSTSAEGDRSECAKRHQRETKRPPCHVTYHLLHAKSCWFVLGTVQTSKNRS